MANNKVCFLSCENYLPEIQAVINSLEDQDLYAACFPARCGHPAINLDEIKHAMGETWETCEEVHIFGGVCLLSSLQNQISQDRLIHLHLQKQCFYLLTNRELVDYLLQEGAYLVTPGWLERWIYWMEQAGFQNQDQAQQFFCESARKLVLLDSCVSSTKNRLQLQEFSNYANLPAEIIPVGLEHLRFLIEQILAKKKMASIQQRAIEKENELIHQIADYAMALDLIKPLAQINDEKIAVEKIIELFQMLFAPQTLVYASLEEHDAQIIYGKQLDPSVVEMHSQQIRDLKEEYYLHENGAGFTLPINRNQQLLGFLIVGDVHFPEYTQRYLNLALSMTGVFGLAIENSRHFYEIKQQQEEAHRLAITDSLTGIFNRRHLFFLAENELERSRRYHHPLAVLMIDLDEFKEVNDRYGHLVGDQVLQTTSFIIRQSLRKVDICGRYGGEEFVILMPETDHEKALQAAERLRQTIAEFPILLSDENISVTTSIGVACCDSQDDLHLEILLNRADEALYQSKHLGRNRVCVWERKQIPPFA